MLVEPALTLPELLAQQATQYPQRLALRYKQRGQWYGKTWAQLAWETEQLAAALLECGFGTDDALILIGSPRPEALLLALAAQALGGVAIPLDPKLENAALNSLLKHLNSPFVFIENEAWLPRLQAYLCELDICIYALGKGDTPARCVFSYNELISSHRRVRSSSFTVKPQQTAFRFYRFNEQQEPEFQSFSHAALLANAQALIQQEYLNNTDDAFSTRAFAAPEQARYLLAPWLLAGFCANFPERLETRDTDRRELSPSFVLGTRTTWQRLIQLAATQLPRAGTWRRRWIEAALQPSTSLLGKLKYHSLDAWLIRRPLKKQLGLSHTRVALLVGEPLAAEHQAWFKQLGLEIRAYPDASSWQVEATQRPSPSYPVWPQSYPFLWVSP